MKKVVLGILPLLLVACSSSPKKTESDIEKIVTSGGSTLAISYGFGDVGIPPVAKSKTKENFRVITRGHTAGKAVFNGVVGGILCNPFSLLSCSWGDLGFSKEQLEGDITNITNISRSYAYPKYITLLKNNIKFSDVKDYSPIPIYFYGDDNYLVYDNESYKLKVGFKIYLSNTNPDGAFKCEEEKTGIPYEKWIADNYFLAVAESKKLVDKCFERLNQHHFENLGDMLKERRMQFL